MKKSTLGNLIIAAIAIAIMMAIVFLPLRVEAASTPEPYCKISYDSAVGANTIKYYSYNKDGVATLDNSRYVKFVNGVIADGSNEIITISQMPGTDACWTPDGQYLVWIESDGSVQCRKYSAEVNVKLATGAKAIELDLNDTLFSISFKDGTSKSAAELFSSSTKPEDKPSDSGSASGNSGGSGSGSSSGSGGSGSSDSKPADQSKPADPAPATTPIKEWTDSAGQEHYEFSGHAVLVDGKKIYLDQYRISELCDSGVRFVGVDTSNRVYLYEDSTSSFYRFTLDNIFQPEKIKFMSGSSLLSVKTDKTGHLTEVVTSIGTYVVGQLVADKVWYPEKNYAIMKYVSEQYVYCQFYVADTSEVHKLEWKSGTLYLDGNKVATGIKRPTESFGFKGAYYYYLKGNKAYRAKISAPAKTKVWKKKVKKLTYSQADGTVSGAK